MDLPNGTQLPDDATIVFIVSGGKKFPLTGPCERLQVEALKCDDDGISVTWVERFEGDELHRFQEAARAAGAGIAVRKTGVVARIVARDFRAFLEHDANKVEIVLAKIPGNHGHCLIKGITEADGGLKLLASQAFKDFIPVGEVPDLVNA